MACAPDNGNPESGKPENGKADDVVRVNFEFKRELAKKIEGNLASFCYQCGACTGDCAAAEYSDEFSPREIMLKVLYGMENELIRHDSVIWHCTNCYNCHERCPQEVKPVEVIISMKNMLADKGIYPDPVKGVIAAFEKEGRTVAYNPAIDRNRKRFGLKPLVPVPMDEIAAIIGADADEAEEAQEAREARLAEATRQAEEGGEG